MKTDLSSLKEHFSAAGKDSIGSLSVDQYYTMAGDNCWEKYKNTHIKVMNASNKWRTRYVAAGNGVGKSLMSCAEHVYHATGRYPFWWEGIRFQPGVKVKGNLNIYPNVVTILMTQQMITIYRTVLPFLLGKKYSMTLNPAYAGGGMIKREWLYQENGVPEIRKDRNTQNINCILVNHVDGITISEIHLVSSSQGSDAIVSSSASFGSGDEKIKPHLKDELHARIVPRYNDGRLLFTNTEDQETSSIDPYMRVRMQKGEHYEELPSGRKVPAYKVFWIKSADIPHISEDQRGAMKGNMSSVDAYTARDEGMINIDADRIITADYDDYLIKDEGGNPIDFTNDLFRREYLSDLEKEGYVPIYAVDTGTSTFGCLYGYVKLQQHQQLDGRVLQLEKIDDFVIADGYNYHAVRAGTKYKSIKEHADEIYSMVQKNNKVIHCGIIDGTARIDRTNENLMNFCERFNQILFDSGNSLKESTVRNSVKFNRAGLQPRIKFLNELFIDGRIRIMYSKKPSTLHSDIDRGTYALREQLRGWRYERTSDGKLKPLSALQKSHNVHMVKDCLTTMIFSPNLMWMYNSNKNVRFNNVGTHSLGNCYKLLEQARRGNIRGNYH